MATLFEGKAWDFVLKVGSSTKLDPTLNTSPTNIRSDFNDNQPFFNGFLSSKVGTLSPCWDLLTRLGIGITCELALSAS